MVKLGRYGFLFSTIILIVMVLDQSLKWIMLNLNPSFSTGFFAITVIKNTGAGFGILQGQTMLLAAISFLVAAGIIMFYPRLPQNQVPQVLTALFLGGVLGNLLDRVIRGYVIDFIDFSFWPAFNVADTAITAGAVGLVIYFWKK